MPYRQIRALVVEDNSGDRLVIKSMLSHFKLDTVHEAEDGFMAKMKILSGEQMGIPYDYIFLDWKMPAGSGYDLLKFLRSSDKFKSLRVIIMTATASEKVVHQALAEGIDDFLIKPVTLSLLK